jgi:CheY-like chemotaxis protein
MKLILLISILLTTLLYAKTQIVIGTFSKETGANVVKKDLDNVINQDSSFKKFLEKNSVQSLIKEDDKYLIVVLEPFLDKKVQDTVLEKIKQTKFKDAYVLKLDEQIYKEINEQKEDLKVAKVTPVKVKTKKMQSKKEVRQNHENFVLKYMTEIIILLVILILIITYIFTLKNRQNKNIEWFEDIQKEIEVQEIEVQEIEEVEKTEEVATVINEPDDIQDTQDTQKLKSNIVKKDVPPHTKIFKKDFKEFEGFRILIAEDNLINQKVIKGILSESGIDLTILNDGQEVLKQLEKDDRFCIILMDVHMPNMDGFEATKAIRQNQKYSHITVVALSGDVATDDIKKMTMSGMQENLEKPLSMDSLYDILYAYGYH